MTLQAGFQFSQSNLQDYFDCQRRFQLRHVFHIAWPAVEAMPAIENEYFIHLGASFHYLVRQHQSGVPVENLTASIPHLQKSGGDELAHWWENYLTFMTSYQDLGPIVQPGSSQGIKRLAELSLSAPISDFRMVAKYDLLAFLPSGKIIIIDWKTNRTRPKRRWLLDRIQTHIYPYLLVQAGSELNNGHPINPEQVEMCYWFANFPTEIEQIYYSVDQYQSDMAFLSDLVEKINQKTDNEFPLTHNDLNCRFCVYRSLCDRGILAGQLDQNDMLDHDDNASIDLNFDQITEIDF